MNKKSAAIIVLCIIVVSIVAYESFKPSAPTGGTIRVSGAFALYPLMVKWAEEYQKIHPEIRIEISAGGAGKGMADALSGLVEIGMISRQIYPEEVAEGAFYVSVTKAGVVATVNNNNPVLDDLLKKGVTKQTFYNIFIAGNVTTWGQVVGRPEVTDPIQVYTRSDAAGAAESWANYLGKRQENLKGVGVYGDPGLVEAVSKDRLGIGFNNLAYAYDNDTKRQVEGTRVVPIDLNGNGQIDQTENFYETKDQIVNAIAQGIYPSPPTQTLYLVTKGKFTGITKAFVTWILTDGQKFVEEAGYVPLSGDVISAQLQKLQS